MGGELATLKPLSASHRITLKGSQRRPNRFRPRVESFWGSASGSLARSLATVFSRILSTHDAPNPF